MRNQNETPSEAYGDNFVITVGRQFGSGGRELGQLLAKALGIEYFDKELLVESAKIAGVHPSFFEDKDERFPSFLNGIYSFAMGCNPLSYYTGATSISDDNLYKSMSEFLQSTAKEKSFVVVGRSADYILRDHPNCINIFVHAPMEDCVTRITSRNDAIDRTKARALAEKTNRCREEFYNFFTDKTWGHASSYHLTIDSSSMPMEEIVNVVIEYLRRKGVVKEK